GRRREKRIVDLFDVLTADANASVLNEDFNFRIGRLRTYAQFAAVSHRIARIEEQIQKNLLKFASITKRDLAVCAKITRNPDPRTFELMFEQRQCFVDRLMNIDIPELCRIRP